MDIRISIYKYLLITTGIIFSTCNNKELPILEDCLPKIITVEISNITDSTAISGGYIIDDGCFAILAKGVCWSTSQKPSITDNHTNDGEGFDSFTSYLIGLNSNISYYIRAYATNIIGTTYGNQWQFCPFWETGTVNDIDGNAYNTVVIGSQIWLKENLKTTHYRDGTSIPKITNYTTWSNLTTGAYKFYKNDTTNATIYGYLYNYYTVSNIKNLCPTGWHVPTYDEWTILINYLGGESLAGSKLKEAGILHWESPNTYATNESTFTALPGGCCSGDFGFFFIRYIGFWWCSTEYNNENAWLWEMMYDNSGVYNEYMRKTDGYSIRCIKD